MAKKGKSRRMRGGDITTELEKRGFDDKRTLTAVVRSRGVSNVDPGTFAEKFAAAYIKLSDEERKNIHAPTGFGGSNSIDKFIKTVLQQVKNSKADENRETANAGMPSEGVITEAVSAGTPEEVITEEAITEMPAAKNSSLFNVTAPNVPLPKAPLPTKNDISQRYIPSITNASVAKFRRPYGQVVPNTASTSVLPSNPERTGFLGTIGRAFGAAANSVRTAASSVASRVTGSQRTSGGKRTHKKRKHHKKRHSKSVKRLHRRM